MIIEREEISLVEETYAYVSRASDEENAKIFKERICNYIKALKELVDSDFDKLTDEEFYKMLCNIYCISLSESDYLKMLSRYYNQKYSNIYTIPTTMTFTDTATEGHGHSFDYWEQLYQVFYLVATSSQFKFDFNKTYTKDEIKKLLSSKDIIILNKEDTPIDEDEIEFNEENYESLPTLGIEFEDFDDNISQFVLNNFWLLGELLRKKFTKRFIIKDVKALIEELDEELRIIFSDVGKSYSSSMTAAICKEWFLSSNENAEYKRIQTVLKRKK